MNLLATAEAYLKKNDFQGVKLRVERALKAGERSLNEKKALDGSQDWLELNTEYEDFLEECQGEVELKDVKDFLTAAKTYLEERKFEDFDDEMIKAKGNLDQPDRHPQPFVKVPPELVSHPRKWLDAADSSRPGVENFASPMGQRIGPAFSPPGRQRQVTP